MLSGKGFSLLLDDLQDFHGASLDADAAGNALGSGSALVVDHELEGAGLDALAAAGAELLVDHVDTGLGILGDGTGLAGLGAQTALGADLGLGSALTLHDLDAGLGDIVNLVESLGTSLNALQAGHALGALLDRQLLHMFDLLFRVLLTEPLYYEHRKKSTDIFEIFSKITANCRG